jgi:hypothetical protein
VTNYAYHAADPLLAESVQRHADELERELTGERPCESKLRTAVLVDLFIECPEVVQPADAK